MHRPSCWLRDVHWESQGALVASSDRKVFASLVKMIGWFLSQEAAPDELSVDDLYIDDSGIVCSTRVYQKGFLDSVLLEQFVNDCCRGNKTIYRQLMQQSGLAEHPGMQFLYWIVQCAVTDQEIDIAEAAADRRIGDGRLVALGKAWYEEARQHPTKADEKRILADLYPPKLWG
jgi:hypothetical protein